MAIDVVSKYGMDMTGVGDNSAKLQQWVNDMLAQDASGKPHPRYVFTEGVLAYDHWPDFHLPPATLIHADGECVLKCMGPGDAVTFKGVQETNQHSAFTGFTIVPTHGHGLVLYSIHGADIKVHCEGAPQGKACVYVWFAVLTNYWLTVQPNKWFAPDHRASYGIVFDSEPARDGQPAQPSQETSKCVLWAPNISEVDTGIVIQSGGMNDIISGAVEGCGTGFHGINGGNNHILFTDFEANSVCDIKMESGFHNNFYLYGETQSNTKINNSNLTNEFKPTWADTVGL